MKKTVLLSVILTLVLPSRAENPQPPEPSKPDGIIGGHEYVDLGLPSGTLWATYNLGASSPYEKGQYFAWGEVEPREDFSWESYKFFLGIANDPETGPWIMLEDIGKDISGTEYDAACHQWGNGWRLPNKQERYELCMLCWTNGSVIENGVRGVRLHGPNEHSIFLPICGFGLWYGDPDPFHNTSAAYWTGTEEPEYEYNGRPIEPSNVAKSFAVERDAGFTGATSPKAYGLNIRAVVNPKETGINEIKKNYDSIAVIYHDGYLHIQGVEGSCQVIIHDLSGRHIYSTTAEEGLCTLPPLTEGVYIVSAYASDRACKPQKIIIL